jgi:hypothetical protein
MVGNERALAQKDSAAPTPSRPWYHPMVAPIPFPTPPLWFQFFNLTHPKLSPPPWTPFGSLSLSVLTLSLSVLT